MGNIPILYSPISIPYSAGGASQAQTANEPLLESPRKAPGCGPPGGRSFAGSCCPRSRSAVGRDQAWRDPPDIIVPSLAKRLHATSGAAAVRTGGC
jgi:hypothetical protein